MKISELIEGWRNKIIPKESLKELIKKTSEERLEICSQCPFDSKAAEKAGTYTPTIRFDRHCLNCGCTLSAKTSCLSCSCPLSKWLAVATDEEDNDVNSIIHDNI